MKKRTLGQRLALRKDTLRTLGEDALGQAAGGVTLQCSADNTCNEICIATTLARGCVHHPSQPCDQTMGCTGTCNHACTNTCTWIDCDDP